MTNSVHFDGTNDFLSRGGGLTGAVDSKLWTGSFWIKPEVNNVVYRIHYSSHLTTLRLRMDRTSGNAVRLYGSSPLDMKTSDGTVLSGGFTHILFSVDMSDPTKRHLYVNDVSDINVTAYTDGAFFFTTDDHAIGASASGFTKLEGDLAEVWLAFGVYIDLSMEANRRKFISSTGKPVDLGADGSTPTGTAPIIFLSGITANWHENKGTGGGFTENGELTNGDPLPEDLLLEAIISSQSQLIAALRPSRHFVGAINAVSAVVGLTEVIRDLVSEIASLSAAEGSFQISGTADFIGVLVAASAGAGEISVDYTIDGGLDSFSTLAGSLDKTLPLVGLLAAQSSMTGALLEEFGTITSFEVFKPKPAELQGVYG